MSQNNQLHRVPSAGHATHTEEIRNACKSLIEKPKTTLGCLRWKWKNNVKTDLKEIKLTSRGANSNKKDVAEMMSEKFC